MSRGILRSACRRGYSALLQRRVGSKNVANPLDASSSTCQRSIASTSRANAGMGSPTGTSPPPSAPLEEENELIWDAGDKHPEPALDYVPPKIVGKYEALGMLAGALCVMGGVYMYAEKYDKASRVPFVPREIEKNLKVELGK